MIRDKRGSTEILAFIFILPLILIPLLFGFYSYTNLNEYDILKQVSREALLRMEIKGGLSEGDRIRIVEFLEDRGFDISKVHLDYTPVGAQFGEKVQFRISYRFTKKDFGLDSMGRLKKTEKEEVMVYGPVSTTSKFYQRQ